MKTLLNNWLEKIRRVNESYGFSCDYCGAEIFEYPQKRLCYDCRKSLSPLGERYCPKCGRETKAEGVCLDCKAQVRAFTQGFAPFVYRGETASLINSMKNGKPRLAVYCAERMSAHFIERYPHPFPEADDPFLLIPVPVTPKKKRERGYNQAEQIARSIFRDFQRRGIPAEMDFEILQKNRDNSAQKQMSIRERELNVQGAYHVHKRKACRNRTILLIDDILTTGTTSGECAERLLHAGAKAVYLLVIAAVPEKE